MRSAPVQLHPFRASDTASARGVREAALNAITIRDLHKKFRHTTALAGLNLQVAEGLYLATEISIAALIATAAGNTVAGHLAAEERARRLDPLLATPLSRRRLMAAYLSWAFGLPAVLMLLFTTAAWSVDRSTSAQLELAPLLRASAATFPAMWTVVAVSLFLFGIRSAWGALSWGVLVLAATAAQFGGLLSLPGWTRGWSPFEHLAAYPADHLNMTTIALMTAIAAVLSAAGLLASGTVSSIEC